MRPTELETIDLHRSFGARQVLRGVSMKVGQGEAVGLFGRDGAGKTVTFQCILGLLKPDSGRVMLKGRDISWLPFYRRAILGLGYLPQQSSIFRGLTVAQNIMAVLETVETDREIRQKRLEELLEDLRIAPLRDAMATSLSGGERRRCEVARALALDPAFILLDEPFAGIDPLTIANIKAIVRDFKKRGIGVLMTDQNIPEIVEVIDRAYLIEDGKIMFSGTPDEMLHDEDVITRFLGRDE